MRPPTVSPSHNWKSLKMGGGRSVEAKKLDIVYERGRGRVPKEGGG